jgi:hypothetical protein
MTDQEIISLKTYMESQLAAQRERFDILIQERDKALDLQFKETSRRLGDLNHEGDRIRGVLEKSVPREIYEGYVKDQAVAAGLLATQVEQVRTTLEKQVETVKTTLEKSSKETTDRLEAQIKELRDRQQISTGEKSGSAEVVTRLIALAGFAASVIAVALSRV